MIGWISRAPLWQKFSLIGLIAACAAAVPSVLVIGQEWRALTHAQTEAAGIAPAGDILELVRLTQQHRGQSAGALSGNTVAKAKREELQPRVAQALDQARQSVTALDAQAGSQGQALQAQWQNLTQAVAAQQWSGEQSNQQHTALIESLMDWLDATRNAAGLEVEPEPANSHLIAATLLHLPRMAENLGQARARGAAILGKGEATAEQRVLVRAIAENARTAFRAARAALQHADAADPSLGPALDKQTAEALSAAESAIATVQDKIVSADRLDYPVADYLATMTRAIDVQYQLIGTTRGVLSQRLDERASASRAKLTGLLLAIAVLTCLGGTVIFVIARGTLRELGGEPEYAADIVRAVANGNLAIPVQTRPGDRSSLLAAMAMMREHLSRTVHHVRLSSDSIATGSGEIATGNADLSQRTEEQASNLQHTASSMEQLGGTVRLNAETAQSAAQLAASASEVASRGGSIVGEVVATMSDIHARSQKIADIIGVIDGIAFQTNILALNAAVEAARAGEHGRGFAVVAGEVRSLSQRSAEAAREIKALINASVDTVATGTALVDNAGHTMQDIVAQVRQVSDLIAEISHASREQTVGISQVTDAVAQLDQVTQQNAALVEQSAAAADSLSQQARKLVEAVSFFKTEATA
ncbi:MAG: methyl-accepting chemotaxis protein [Acidobacteriota bacterium]